MAIKDNHKREKMEDIKRAAQTLGLGNSASIREIKSSYRRLMLKWHPDQCNESPDECAEQAKRIMDAYEVLMDYCTKYRFSFTDDELSGTSEEPDPAEWWFEHFGNDPLWGPGSREKEKKE